MFIDFDAVTFERNGQWKYFDFPGLPVNGFLCLWSGGVLKTRPFQMRKHIHHLKGVDNSFYLFAGRLHSDENINARVRCVRHRLFSFPIAAPVHYLSQTGLNESFVFLW